MVVYFSGIVNYGITWKEFKGGSTGLTAAQGGTMHNLSTEYCPSQKECMQVIAT